ncbi:hypothetical protein [Vulcanisaeta distributa]|uniref:hypothetical protein n=1 Tax=Vulcanisaeta distributa TaxID=164451 RepID=UPI0006CFF8FA|nr:hypothetical protein [Vulcanisaeta distributa]
MCVGGYGFPYNETIGLPNGAGVVALPAYVMRRGPILYRVYCVVSLFIRFSIDRIIMPSIYPNASTVIIRLPMIAVFNDDSLVALFNYTWIGNGNVGINLNNGYAIINVTTPCQAT